MSTNHPVLSLHGVDALTPEVLGTLVRDAKQIDESVRVRSFRIAGGPASGLIGTVSRIHLEYEPSSAPGPRSLIAKFPSTRIKDGPALSAVEARFYKHQIPKLSSLRAPRVYYCDLDENTGQSCLILEDLGDRGFIRQIEGCSPEQAALAIREIAKLHARWWNRDLPTQLSWIRPPGESPIGLFCERWLRSYEGEWPEPVQKVAGRLRDRYDDLALRLAWGPRTVVHGDFHSGNISFDDSNEAALVDFQFVQRATGMLDVARFLATSLQVDVRRAIQWDLLREYQRSLESRGVEDYSLERCIDHLRMALLWNLTTPLALHLVEIMTRGRTWPSTLPIIERCLTAIEDWEALEAL